VRLILCVWYRRDEEDGDVGEGEGGAWCTYLLP